MPARLPNTLKSGPQPVQIPARYPAMHSSAQNGFWTTGHENTHSHTSAQAASPWSGFKLQASSLKEFIRTFQDPRKFRGSLESLNSSGPQGFSPTFAHLATVKDNEEDSLPLLVTPGASMQIEDPEDDEVIICIDGGDVHTAWKKAVWGNFQAEPSRTAKAKAFTMYKRVDRKIKPVPVVFPEDARVVRNFPENPLLSLPALPFRPPEFTQDTNGRLTQERLEAMNINPKGFLWPEEEKLFKHILKLNQNYFVFEDSQRGSF